MFEFDGRKILTTLEEKVDPRHAAVIVIDMQKDFTTRGGFSDRLGMDIGPMDALAARLSNFLNDARAYNVPIVHVMANYDPQFMSDPMHERLQRHGLGRYCQSGTEGIQYHEGLEPRPGELVVIKHRFDAFYDTELNILLQTLGVKSVILSGVAVHACVDSSARHAYFLGYYVVFGADLAGGAPNDEVHQVTLDTMNTCFGITATADEIVNAWRSSRTGAEAAGLVSASSTNRL